MSKKTPRTATPETAAPATAPKAPAAPPRAQVPEQLIRIPLNCLIPSPNNPRHIDPKSHDIKELADSIRANGLLQPGVARPGKTPGTYELLAGGRRYVAHQQIAAFDMLCIVRDLDDKTAMEVTVLENLQRTDLTPFEEAAGVQSLLDTGHPIEEIAAEVGKTPSWVARRARLNKLTPKARKAIEKAGSTIQQMILLATLPPALQDEIAEDEYYALAPDRGETLERELADRMMLLKSAPFGAARCVDCTKRTDLNPLLFGDDTAPAKDAKCLDRKCWNERCASFLDARLKQEANTPGLIQIRTARAPYGTPLEKIPELGTNDRDNYKKAKKGDPKAIPGIIVHGPGLGTVINVVPGRQASKSDMSGKPAKKIGADGKPVPPKPHERQLGLHQKRCAWMVNHFEETVVGNLGDLFAKCSHAKALNILLAFGSSHNSSGDMYYNSEKRETAWTDYVEFGGGNGPDAGTLEAGYDNGLRDVFKNRCRYQGLDQAERAFVEAARICRLLGYPLFKEHHAECMKALPVPKSWGKGIRDPWADQVDGTVADPFDAKHELPRTFNAAGK